MKSRTLIFLAVSLLIISFFVFEWSREKSQSEHLKDVQGQLIFRKFTYLTKELNGIAETLTKYDAEFTKTEMSLFTQLLDKDIRTLNESGMNLAYLLPPTSLDGILIYENYIWKIEKWLGEIQEGEIIDEKTIHLIGNTIGKQTEQLSAMFYGEEQVGVEGINSKQEITKVIEIIDMMNSEIEGILGKRKRDVINQEGD